MSSSPRRPPSSPDRDHPRRRGGRAHAGAFHRTRETHVDNRDGADSPEEEEQEPLYPGGRHFMHVGLTGRDFIFALVLCNGIVAAACALHAILFLPPYGLLYNGPARPGHNVAETYLDLPSSAQGQSSSNGLALDPHRSENTGSQSDSNQTQSANANNPAFGLDAGDRQAEEGQEHGQSHVSTSSPSARTEDRDNPPAAPHVGGPLSEEMVYALGQQFIYTLEWGWNTGDAEPLALMSAPNCSVCQTIKADITSAHTDSRTIQGVHYEVLDGARILKVDPPKAPRITWVALLPIRISEHRIIEKAQVKTVAPAETTLEINFQEIDGVWKVTAFGPAIAQTPKNQE